jgi:ribosomal protein S4E
LNARDNHRACQQSSYQKSTGGRRGPPGLVAIVNTAAEHVAETARVRVAVSVGAQRACQAVVALASHDSGHRVFLEIGQIKINQNLLIKVDKKTIVDCFTTQYELAVVHVLGEKAVLVPVLHEVTTVAEEPI